MRCFGTAKVKTWDSAQSQWSGAWFSSGVQNPTKHEPMSILSIAYSTFWKQSRVDANEEERFSMTSIQTLILRLQWEQETCFRDRLDEVL